MEKDKYKFADLFAGCGGLSYGFVKSEKFKHVVATDMWQQAKETYEFNFKNSKYILGDLRNENDISRIVAHLGNDLDLLIGGPPCKGFSTLNNAKIHSQHNTLVDQYLNIVELITPKIFLMENVRGFQSKRHPSGITYPEHVKNRIGNFNHPYFLSEFLINACDYGVAQNRIRYFMIGISCMFDPDNRLSSVFANELKARIDPNKIVLRDAIFDLPQVKVREGSDEMTTSGGKKIHNHKSMNHSKKLEERLKHVSKHGGLLDVPYELLTSHLRKVIDGGYGSGGFMKNIYGRMDWNSPSGTIVAGMDKITVGRFVHPEENRLLTPRECARIQSFPDEFRFLGGMVNQYYQIGNAVPPKISELLCSIFCEILNNK
jgi:DNA (cytosine-5)-methyltransferase 1